MRAKAYLRQIASIDNSIEHLKDHINSLRESAFSIVCAPDGERVQTSKRQDAMERVICRYIDDEASAFDKMLQLQRQKAEIIHTIEQLPPTESGILYAVYVKKERFSDIADRIDRSYSYVTKKHNRGMKLLQILLDDKEDSNE